MKISGPAGQPKELGRGIDDLKDLKRGRGPDEIGKDKDLKDAKPMFKPAAGAPEKVDISAKAKDIDKAKKLADAAPDVNADKIAKLKEAIAKGNYKVNAEAIADKLVDDHLKTTVL